MLVLAGAMELNLHALCTKNNFLHVLRTINAKLAVDAVKLSDAFYPIALIRPRGQLASPNQLDWQSL